MALTVIDNDTGMVLREFSEADEPRITTRQDRERAKQHIELRKHNDMQRDMMTEFAKGLGGFIFAVYEMSGEFNRHGEVLTQADITRLIVIGTYTNFDGVLWHGNGKFITRANMNDVLNLSKSAFNEFYAKLVQLGIVIEDGDRLRMNDEYFFKDTIKGHKDGVRALTRVYIKTVRDLYMKTPARSHKLLGAFFRVIPFINREWNIVCHNPQETCLDNVRHMTLSEMATNLHYCNKAMGILKDELVKLRLMDGSRVIWFIENGQDKRAMTMCVNPKVIYGGSDYSKVEVMSHLGV